MCWLVWYRNRVFIFYFGCDHIIGNIPKPIRTSKTSPIEPLSVLRRGTTVERVVLHPFCHFYYRQLMYKTPSLEDLIILIFALPAPCERPVCSNSNLNYWWFFGILLESVRVLRSLFVNDLIVCGPLEVTYKTCTSNLPEPAAKVFSQKIARQPAVSSEPPVNENILFVST
jgi:hypothetical protein